MVCLPDQLCPTLCDIMDCSPPGSSVHGISQAGIPDWVAFPSPGDLPDPGIQLNSLPLCHLWSPNYYTWSTIKSHANVFFFFSFCVIQELNDICVDHGQRQAAKMILSFHYFLST